ncbi:chorismate mutase [Desulforamulus ruminis]|uniref:chorismate mutase n=1 Tax=Desulforamulus ruminis (strain ATCC 23193 / DSM 2154 / NCIMB 8452 / DL) TaxID=696281 RepID=F6DT67_DESRL|nr:chorismate mutase [Desulforamulus ruminis]AEG61172.1 chorismate mutase [Desulforamulus ruminis DSM 2154]
MGTVVRGIRGAITVERNESQQILEATQELLEKIVQENHLDTEDICSAFFTVTQDLDTEFPAKAARALGWTSVPLMCTSEVNVAGALPKCIRVLIHINTGRSQSEIKHVYLGRAVQLRPDLVG